jgi:hypothetical protein
MCPQKNSLAVNLIHAKKMETLAKKHGIQLITNYETTWYGSHHQAFDGPLIEKIRKYMVKKATYLPIKQILCGYA